MASDVIVINKADLCYLRGESRQNQYSILKLHALNCEETSIYKRDGIDVTLNTDFIKAALKLFQEKLGVKIKGLNIVLPHSVCWFHYIEVEDLPKNQNEAEEFIMWKIQKVLPIPKDIAIIKHLLLTRSKDSSKLLVSATFKSFITSLEGCLRGLGFVASYISPPTLAFLNVFQRNVPQNGTIFWLRELSYSMVCFYKGYPVVLREVDKPLSLNRIETELFIFNQSVKEIYPDYSAEKILFFDELKRDNIKNFFPPESIELDYKPLVQKSDADIQELSRYISGMGLLE